MDEQSNIFEVTVEAMAMELADGKFHPSIKITRRHEPLIDPETKIIVMPFDDEQMALAIAREWAQHEIEIIKAALHAAEENYKRWMESPERERLLAESRERIKTLMSESVWAQSDIVWDSARMRFGLPFSYCRFGFPYYI